MRLCFSVLAAVGMRGRQWCRFFHEHRQRAGCQHSLRGVSSTAGGCQAGSTGWPPFRRPAASRQGGTPADPRGPGPRTNRRLGPTAAVTAWFESCAESSGGTQPRKGSPAVAFKAGNGDEWRLPMTRDRSAFGVNGTISPASARRPKSVVQVQGGCPPARSDKTPPAERRCRFATTLYNLWRLGLMANSGRGGAQTL